jgi:hypothetical protein
MSACSLSKHTTWRVRRRQLPVLLTVCLASLVALGDTASDDCPESAVRIHVDPLGLVRVNGAVVPPGLLKQMLASLKPKPTEICFASVRLFTMLTPTEAAAALDASETLGVPMSFYDDATYKTRYLTLPSDNRSRSP